MTKKTDDFTAGLRSAVTLAETGATFAALHADRRWAKARYGSVPVPSMTRTERGATIVTPGPLRPTEPRGVTLRTLRDGLKASQVPKGRDVTRPVSKAEAGHYPKPARLMRDTETAGLSQLDGRAKRLTMALPSERSLVGPLVSKAMAKARAGMALLGGAQLSRRADLSYGPRPSMLPRKARGSLAGDIAMTRDMTRALADEPVKAALADRASLAETARRARVDARAGFKRETPSDRRRAERRATLAMSGPFPVRRDVA